MVAVAAYVTAELSVPLLCGYTFYVNGSLVNLGPGRGEAPVWGGDGLFRSLPYTSLEVTEFFQGTGPTALALEVMHQPPSARLQLVFVLGDGTVKVVGSDGSWQAFNGDVHRKPGPPTHGSSAGTGFLEYIDAR